MSRPTPPFDGLKRVCASTKALASLHNLKTFLGCEEIVLRGESEGAVGWGLTQSLHSNYIHAEDGFYRSVGLGKNGVPPLSLIFDRVAPFASIPSNLRPTIDLKEQILGQRLTKYNVEPFEEVRLELHNALIIDQVWGDKSIELAKATHESFFEMVQAARAENPKAKLYLKTHPDVLAGKAKGILTPHARALKLELITGHPHAILQEARAVYTVSSFMGVEAMLFGLQPRVFGESFYKGKNIEPLLEGMLNHYSHFVDPVLNKPITASEGLNRLAHWRDKAQDLHKKYYLQGFKRWKKPFYSKIFPHQGKGGESIHWGRSEKGISLEDGFIRSKGLGSNFIPPASLILDRQGIYFDATRPSDFEQLCNSHFFTLKELARAKNVQGFINTKNLSKYNLGGESKNRPPFLLVLGQVAGDKSLEFGTVSLKTNVELLSYVRAQNPKAHIIYKEHPDVSSGNRGGKIAGLEADEMITQGDSLPLLEGASSVHTLTSLGGFEALMRGKPVHCYGLPFYAGWGLTQDLHICARRQRVLTLEELIYLALIKYPRYFCTQTQIPCDIEDTLIQLEKAEVPLAQFRFWRYVKAMWHG